MSERKYVECDPEKCTGCSICEFICSLEKERVFSPIKSRITTIRVTPLVNISTACKLCKDPPCVTACPLDALSQSEETGIIHVDEEQCTACGWCVRACEHGAIKLVSGRHPEKSVVTICDLCEGRKEGPVCIEWCPEEALELKPHDTQTQKNRLAILANLYNTASK